MGHAEEGFIVQKVYDTQAQREPTIQTSVTSPFETPRLNTHGYAHGWHNLHANAR